MSDKDGSTKFSEKMLDRFQSNPVGLTVELLDGQLAKVAAFTDTPRGRWLRLRAPDGRFGPWVPQLEVLGVRYFEVRALDPATLTDRRHA